MHPGRLPPPRRHSRRLHPKLTSLGPSPPRVRMSPLMPEKVMSPLMILQVMIPMVPARGPLVVARGPLVAARAPLVPAAVLWSGGGVQEVGLSGDPWRLEGLVTCW